MNLNLNGRMALVTGSSHGLGKEIAFTLAQAGAKVIICGRDTEKLESALREAEEAHGLRLVGWQLDASSNVSIADHFRSFLPQYSFGKEETLDILVNNIGGAPKFGKFEDLNDEDWLNTFNLNLMSAVRFTRAALPFLRKSKHGGRIINIGSLPGIQPGGRNPDYAVAKAGLIALTKCLANEFGPEGIRTNCICPNTLNGGGLERNAKDRAKNEGISVDEARKKILESAAKKNPLGKVGELSDVASAVAFLASDAAQFINGTCIRVDGGECRSI